MENSVFYPSSALCSHGCFSKTAIHSALSWKVEHLKVITLRYTRCSLTPSLDKSKSSRPWRRDGAESCGT